MVTFEVMLPIKLFFIIFFISIFTIGNSQTSIGDCIGAIPVCQTTFVQEVSNIGTGFIDPEINDSISCLVLERNSAWYIFNIIEGGDLGFTITPAVEEDDYDWCVFNITGRNCDEIHLDRNFISSCNASGGAATDFACYGTTGADGTTEYSFQGIGCGFEPSDGFGYNPYNALFPVQTGETYVLLVEQWSGSEDGYILSFNLGDAIIVDTTDFAVIDAINIGDLSCRWEGVTLSFSERIDCSNSSNQSIIITNENGEIIDAGIVVNCKNRADGFTQEAEVIFTKPIETSGIYTLRVENAVSDLCGNYHSFFESTLELEISESNIYIPNAFTPNNDGLNDFFEIFPNEKIDEISTFQIFDRWGNLVYNFTNETQIRWDGRLNNKILNPGIYVYQIEFSLITGRTILESGSIQLSR